MSSHRRRSRLILVLAVLAGPSVPCTADSPLGLWTDEDRLSGVPQEDFWGFGEAVDISGDLAIVGAPKATIEGDLNRGAAYIFRRQGANWVQVALLLASDGSAQDGFGWSVAIEGNRAFVGAPFFGEIPELFRGAVYVFEDFDPWFEVQKLLASDGDWQDRFGYSLDVEGDRLAIGARRAGPGADGGGAAYIFEHDGVVWAETQKLADNAPQSFGSFGSSVDLQADTLAVGARNYGNGAPGGGAVYVFIREEGLWVQQQLLEASDVTTIGMLGTDVALDGDTIIAGADQKPIGPNEQQGAAYIFTRSNGVWTEQVRLTASNAQEDGHFGKAVALDGNLALVGGEVDFEMQNNQGLVYEFRLRDGAWEEVQWFMAPVGQGLDNFGEALEIDGERLIVGNSDNGMVDPAGTAWVMLRPLLLFCDGFETGDTSAWSTVVP